MDPPIVSKLQLTNIFKFKKVINPTVWLSSKTIPSKEQLMYFSVLKSEDLLRYCDLMVLVSEEWIKRCSQSGTRIPLSGKKSFLTPTTSWVWYAVDRVVSLLSGGRLVWRWEKVSTFPSLASTEKTDDSPCLQHLRHGDSNDCLVGKTSVHILHSMVLECWAPRALSNIITLQNHPFNLPKKNWR